MLYNKPVMRIRWKLTLSYTLVTAGAILLIEAVLLGVALFLLTRLDALPRLLVPILTDAAGSLAPALTTTPPDAPALQNWLDTLVLTGEIPRGSGRSEVRLHLDPAVLDRALVVDDQARVVVARPEQPCTPGQPATACLPEEAARLVQRALQGELGSERLSHAAGQGIYVAAPILAAPGRSVGAVLVHVTWPQSFAQWPREVLSTLLPSAVVVTLLAAVIGTLFGFFTARGLTRRLTALSQAADAWSRGDFSIQVRDPAADELGALAHHLNRMAERLENLLHAQQQLAALEERQRLARELHDAVKQQVFAAGMQVAAARRHLPERPEQAQEALAQAEALLHQAQQELTALIRELRPAALQGKGLAAALREHLAAWSCQTGMRAELHIQGERRLPLAVEQALWRVAQEALANAARHSGAQQVQVRLTWEGDAVRLTVADDGQGFDPAVVQGRGLGLSSMAERVQALGGRLTVHTAPGRGTRIEATVPCPTTLAEASDA